MLPRKTFYHGAAVATLVGFCLLAGTVSAWGQDARLTEVAQGSQWAIGPTFASPPARANPVSGSACEIADRYVTLQGAARQPELLPLFAQDADVLATGDAVIHGQAALSKYFGVSSPRTVRPISFVDKGRECFMELAAIGSNNPADPYRLVAIDHFTLDENGLIKRLVIYMRPTAGR